MNRFIAMLFCVFLSLLIFPLASGATPLAQKTFLPFLQLKEKPEFWPNTITILEDITFYSQIVIVKGEKLPLHKIEGDFVIVQLHNDSGNSITLKINHTKTTFLQASNEIYTGLTPEQRQITHQNLEKYKVHWPLEIEIIKSIPLISGGTIQPGQKVTLMDSKDGIVHLKMDNNRISLKAASTNILAKTRDHLKKKNHQTFSNREFL